MGYEPTPRLRPPAVVRAFVPALPGSLWSRVAADYVRALPHNVPTLLLSHHLTPLQSPPWDEFSDLFFGTLAERYVNVVFDDRDKQNFVQPKMLGVAATRDDATAPWLPETTRPPLCKFWTAGVPNILVTRPQGRPLTDEEKAMIGKYDAVVTDIEGAVAAMETALGQRVYTSLNLVVADALQLATQILGSAKETP
jgi:hypothetical protein